MQFDSALQSCKLCTENNNKVQQHANLQVCVDLLFGCSCLHRVVDIVEWRMTLVWHLPVTYQVEEQAHRCLRVTRRPVSQDVCCDHY